MISPALTTWPPKRLTPRRCELESRPLRELEAPFLCAMSSLLYLGDSGDLDDRQLLTVALALVVTGLVLELVDADLGTLGVLEHLGGDGDLLQVLGGGGDLRAVDDERHGKRDGVAGLELQLLDLDYVTDRDLVLLAAGLDDCIRRILGCHRARASSASLAGARHPGAACAGLGCGVLEPRVSPARSTKPADNCARVRDQRVRGQTATPSATATASRNRRTCGAGGRAASPGPAGHGGGGLVLLGVDLVVVLGIVVLVGVVVLGVVVIGVVVLGVVVDDFDVVVVLVVIVLVVVVEVVFRVEVVLGVLLGLVGQHLFDGLGRRQVLGSL